MRDVAKLAGVSQRTVSNVVNNYRYVKPDTRERVQRAIETLRYRPNVSAQRLRSGRTGLVALALPEINAPYFADLAAEIQRQAAECGVTLLIDQTGGTRDRELFVLDGYHSNMIDGLIFSPLAVTAADLAQRQLGFPVVLLGESVYASDLVHISVDNVHAARTATEHLLGLGRTRVATIGGSLDIAASNPASARMRGYLIAMGNAGQAIDPARVIDPGEWTRAAGYSAAIELLDRGTGADAIFCFNDTLALGALKALADRGERVPEDIAVIGWDDIDECAYASPTLSSIAPDKGSICRLAVDSLLRLIDGQTVGPTEVLVDYQLATRRSSDGQVVHATASAESLSS